MSDIVREAPRRRPRPPGGWFWLGALLWLPIGVAATSLARGSGLPLEPQAWLSLAVIAPCGLPLALAWFATHRLGYRRTAGAVCGVLAITTVVLSVFAGLLGPIGIAVYAVVLSLPAWILYAALRFRDRNILL